MGFYPHGKPEYFSYTEHFLEVGHDDEGKAKANTAYPGLGNETKTITSKALENLQILIDSARAAEVAFISDTGLNLNDPQSAKDIFNIMNTIFNSKDTFERGMNYLKRLADVGRTDEKEHTYREVSSYFSTYLRQQIKAKLNSKRLAKQIITMTPDQVKDLINNVIGDALVQAYTKVEDFIGPDGQIRGKFGASGKGKAAARDDEQAQQAVSDMIDIIKKLQNQGAFRDYGYLFDLNKETFMGTNDKANRGYKLQKGKKYNKTEVQANYQGNALEFITSVVAAEIGNINIQNENLTITGMHTGQMNQMKADTLLFVAEGPINPQDYLQFVDKTGENKDSVRLQNVDAMQKYLNNLESNLKHVIAISDKNYSIKADFGGVNAQEKMTLQNAGYLLERFGVPNVVPLIHYLANCGADMVQGANVDGEIRTSLQSYIAYFLFDNLQIDINGPRNAGPNVVNMMNVSGIYIPLSVYLEGVYKAIEGSLFNNPSSLVSVSISLGGPTEQSTWTVATWYKFREQHENESFISYRIVKDIASFITGLM